MSRIPTPASIEAAPEAARPLLEAVNKQLGVVPNLFRLVATSPATLEGFLGLSGALGKGKLNLATREGIALAVAQANGCGYCLAAHTYIGANMAKQSAEELALNRRGSSGNAKEAAAIGFALAIVQKRGQVSEAEIAAVRAAGYSDAELLEIVAHTALNTLTNYINEVFATDIDFPTVALAA
ncbi:MAG: alkylhydroperoxidase [Methylobacterium sp.]|nr:MAG: alkylhydroperoxidase [Methylobacterium sp.]